MSTELNAKSYNKVDFSSQSNCSNVVSTDIKLEWDLDFDQQIITGAAEHIMKVLVSGTKTADFDSSKINLTGDVTIDDEKATHTLAPTNPTLGTKISVDIPVDKQYEGATFTIRFQYHITNEASAVQWLAASATKGGKYPYVFTQCQAIHARSLLPCMDSPGVKTTYSAVVTAPKWCTVLMSALADNENSTYDFDANRAKFVWVQPVPTCAYLIALAAGNLKSKDISDRVRIWAEPEVVDAAHYEFAETEEFLVAAESFSCPYVWTRYDVLCLPPSFPYGGMENPCLTFATPTLLAGDRSLADVIAHEIAHSWTGNLVTNHTWDHFWLNEGWTVWLERKIVSKVKGSAEHGRLSAQIGWKHLTDDISLLGQMSPQFTSLVWPLHGEDPDDAFSGVPYEKGFNLLNYLESLVGSESFEAFAKFYINRFRFSTVTSGEFRDCFLEFFEQRAADEAKAHAAISDASSPSGEGKKKNNRRGKKGGAAASVTSPSPKSLPTPCADTLNVLQTTLDWNALFHDRGMPAVTPDFSNSLSAEAEALAVQWIDAAAASTASIPCEVAVPSGVTAGDIKSWSTQQTSIFLEVLLVHCSADATKTPEEVFPPEFLAAMDKVYNFSASHNSEIMSRWQNLCLRSNAEWIFDKVVDFISSQGRMKFVRPLYRALRATRNGKKLAVSTFEAKKGMYHPIARKMLATDLSNAQKADEDEQDGDWEHTTDVAEDVSSATTPPPKEHTTDVAEDVSSATTPPPKEHTTDVAEDVSSATTPPPKAAAAVESSSAAASPVPATPPPAPIVATSEPVVVTETTNRTSPSNGSAKAAFLKKMLNIEKDSEDTSSATVAPAAAAPAAAAPAATAPAATPAAAPLPVAVPNEVKAATPTETKKSSTTPAAPIPAAPATATSLATNAATESKSSDVAKPVPLEKKPSLSIKKPVEAASPPTKTAVVTKTATKGGFFSGWWFPATLLGGVSIAAIYMFARKR